MSKCDIIIPVWNHLKETKACIDSIVEHTKFPYRLIIIDNGSNRKTRGYLESLRNSLSNVLVERNEMNEGFVKAINKGIGVSDADYLCLLNNDTIVTDRWLNEMIDVAEKDPEVGIVNPSSNNLGQKPPPGMSIHEYSAELENNEGRYVDLGTALGFCMLIKRSVINRVGFFDEVFDVGNFEDTDFSLRAKRDGFKVVRARASYVYHKEGTSFKMLKTQKEDFQRNKKIFEERWGKEKRILFILMEPEEYEKAYAQKIKNEIERNTWIYIACKNGIPVTQEHSRIMIYNFGSDFTLKLLFKILFKKKRFDEIYCDNKKFLELLNFLKPIHRASISKISLGEI